MSTGDDKRNGWHWVQRLFQVAEVAPTWKSGEFGTLMLLTKHANAYGLCYPSHDRLARMANQSRATTIRHLKSLELSGHFFVVEGAQRAGQNTYRLAFGDDEQMALARKRAKVRWDAKGCCNLQQVPDSPELDRGRKLQQPPDADCDGGGHDLQQPLVANCDETGCNLQHERTSGTYQVNVPVNVPGEPKNCAQRARPFPHDKTHEEEHPPGEWPEEALNDLQELLSLEQFQRETVLARLERNARSWLDENGLIDRDGEEERAIAAITAMCEEDEHMMGCPWNDEDVVDVFHRLVPTANVPSITFQDATAIASELAPSCSSSDELIDRLAERIAEHLNCRVDRARQLEVVYRAAFAGWARYRLNRPAAPLPVSTAPKIAGGKR
jgi:hypothetical protein